MSNQKQNDTPSLVRWLYRRIFRGFGWVFLAFILTALYLFIHGFLHSK